MRASIVAFAALALVMAMACTTTAVLHERQPVTVAAAPPPPPEPEPEPEPPPRVEVEAERIRVDEKIHFEIDSAEISSQSDDLLEEIAQVLQDNPHVKKVRIEGHTDNTGAARYNMDLSRRRAASVMERLVELGVDADRLVSEGYGLTRPIETNDTPAGRSANRRVEFNILEQDAPPAQPAEAAEQPGAEEAEQPGAEEAEQQGAEEEEQPEEAQQPRQAQAGGDQ